MDEVCSKVISLAIHFKHIGAGSIEQIIITSTATGEKARIEPLPLEKGYLAEWVDEASEKNSS
jgi:hypothetical protein